MSLVNPGPITDVERNYALDLLRESRQRLHQLLVDVSPAQALFKPAPDRWSIAECVEHITLVEMGFVKVLQTNITEPADPAKRNEIRVSDVDVIKAVRSRAIPIQAPSFSVPTGRFSSVETALEVFDQQRASAIHFLQTESGDLRAHYFLHRQLGTLDLYQAALIMAGHVFRHCKQIDEVKTSTGFPEA